MYVALLILVALSSLESLLTNEHPTWLLPLARLRLVPARRFALAVPRRVADDASYRDAALVEAEPWARVGTIQVGGVRVVPSEARRAFAVVATGWRRPYLARIDAAREGDEVVLTARFTPAPITTLPMLLGVVGLLGWRATVGADLLPMLMGMAVGMLVGTGAFYARARSEAEAALEPAFDALESAMIRAASGERHEDERVPAPAPWKGRAAALAPAIAIALLFFMRSTSGGSSEDAAVRALVDGHGVSEPDARRLAPLALEVGAAIVRHPAYHEGIDTAALAASGLPRLSDAELAEHHAIRSRLAASSRELCAQLGSGRVEAPTLLAALAREDDDTLRAWYRLSLRAGELELDHAGEPVPADPRALVDDGLEAMVASLPLPDQAAYAQRLWPERDDDAAWCESFRAIGEGVDRLAPAERAVFLRALATPIPEDEAGAAEGP